MQWNIQGFRSKYQELRTIIEEKNILIACLQETLLGDSNWQPSKQFSLEKSPHIAGDTNRGTAMLLHKSLQYSRVPLRTTIEAIAVTIYSERKITVCSIYISPNVIARKEELSRLIGQLPRPFLLLGDLNAKHPLWDFTHPADQRGKEVEKLIIEESMALLNSGKPTHYHVQNNTYSTIDLSLCSVDALGYFHHETDTDLHGSDHFPLYLSAMEYLPQSSTPRWITGKANWNQFSEMAGSIEDIPESDPLSFYNRVVEEIAKAASASIPRSDGFYKQCPVPWWNKKCDASKKNRNRAQKQLCKHPSITNKMNYKRM